MKQDKDILTQSYTDLTDFLFLWNNACGLLQAIATFDCSGGLGMKNILPPISISSIDVCSIKRMREKES